MLYVRIKILHKEVSTVREFRETDITLNCNYWREATAEEIKFYKQGATYAPAFKINDKVKIVLVAEEDTLRNNSNIKTVNKITVIKNILYIGIYKYFTDTGWWFVEENIQLISSTFVPPKDSLKSFDKDNYYIYLDKKEDFMTLKNQNSIPFYTGWSFVAKRWYGKVRGKPNYKVETPTLIPTYTFKEIKYLITNKIETDEIQEKITTESRRVTGQVYRQNCSFSKITSASRFIGNSVSISRGRAMFGKAKKLRPAIYSRGSQSSR